MIEIIKVNAVKYRSVYKSMKVGTAKPKLKVNNAVSVRYDQMQSAQNQIRTK